MAAEDKDLNLDPITDEPGAHPVGTGVGAAGGALAGAAAGTFAGPVGTMVGGVIGAVVGGLAGTAAGEAVNPTGEEAPGGDREDVIDALQDLVECCKDGEYGFRESAQQAKREDLRSLFLQRADDCRRAADELNNHIRSCGGRVEEGGSAGGALHRGWVSVRSALTAYNDKAVLEECERGEDNAMARYRKALKQVMPAEIKVVVEKQFQGLLRNHDQIRMLRDQFRA